MNPETLKITRDCFETKLMQCVEKKIDDYLDGSYHNFYFKFEHYDKGNKFIIDGEYEIREDNIEICKASETADEFSGVGCYINEIKQANQWDIKVVPDYLPHPSLQERLKKLIKERIND